MSAIRLLMSLALLGLLAACSNDPYADATPETVAQVAYVAPGPKTLTLFTMVNNRTGGGGHTALMVNGAQRVIFDPAGSFRAPGKITERGDVIYGVTPGMLQSYKGAHARASHHVVTQEITVSAEQARRALALVQQRGTVPAIYCASATSEILAQIDGFGRIRQTFYPVELMTQIAAIPGVRTDTYFEDDGGNVVDALPTAAR